MLLFFLNFPDSCQVKEIVARGLQIENLIKFIFTKKFIAMQENQMYLG